MKRIIITCTLCLIGITLFSQNIDIPIKIGMNKSQLCDSLFISEHQLEEGIVTLSGIEIKTKSNIENSHIISISTTDDKYFVFLYRDNVKTINRVVSWNKRFDLLMEVRDRPVNLFTKDGNFETYFWKGKKYNKYLFVDYDNKTISYLWTKQKK